MTPMLYRRLFALRDNLLTLHDRSIEQFAKTQQLSMIRADLGIGGISRHTEQEDHCEEIEDALQLPSGSSHSSSSGCREEVERNLAKGIPETPRNSRED